MLVIIPKCISSQVILKDVHYHKYHLHTHWQISCQSVIMATRQRQSVISCAFLKSEWRPILSGVRSFFTLRVQVVLVSFWYFPEGCKYPHCPSAKLSGDHPLGKLWQHDRINVGLTGLNEWCRHKEKNLAWNRTCWCKLQSLLNSVPFSKMLHRLLKL